MEMKRRRELERSKQEKEKDESDVRNISQQYLAIAEREKEERAMQKKKLKQELDQQKKANEEHRNKELLLNAREFSLNKQILEDMKGEDSINESEQEQLLNLRKAKKPSLSLLPELPLV